uniref:ADP-ribosylation factor-related protein 1 n=1 Tax=Strongyloides stercoralis TaxID=6248 RepID=A0A0K0E456_STRER
MFSLASGIYKQLTEKVEYNVIIVGPDNAGKSTFVENAKNICSINRNIVRKDLKKIHTTVGLNLGKIERGDMIINFWDLGGQEKLRSLWKNYITEAHGIVYVIDGSDEARFEEAKNTYESYIINSQSCPVLIIFNKHDLVNFEEAEKLRRYFEEIVESEEFAVFYCCAIDGTNVERSIIWMENALRDRYTP